MCLSFLRQDRVDISASPIQSKRMAWVICCTPVIVVNTDCCLILPTYHTCNTIEVGASIHLLAPTSLALPRDTRTTCVCAVTQRTPLTSTSRNHASMLSMPECGQEWLVGSWRDGWTGNPCFRLTVGFGMRRTDSAYQTEGTNQMEQTEACGA